MQADNTAGRAAAARPHPHPDLRRPDPTRPAWPAPPAAPPAPAKASPQVVLPPQPPPAPRPHDAGQADSAPQCALHDDRLWRLARRGPGPVLCLEFELHTQLARQAFRRDFAYVSRQMLGLESSRRVQGLDRAALEAALLAVRRREDELLTLFGILAAQLDALPLPPPLPPSPAATTTALATAAPARLRATVLSPSMRRFIELLQAADRVVCRVEHAWLLGVLPPARRSALVGECRRALTGFKELVRVRRHEIGQRVRAVNARARQAPGPE